MGELNRLVDRFNGLSMFYRVVILLVNFVVVFGIVGPSMISSNSTIAVWLGIFILVSDLSLSYVFAKKTIGELMK